MINNHAEMDKRRPRRVGRGGTPPLIVKEIQARWLDGDQTGIIAASLGVSGATVRRYTKHLDRPAPSPCLGTKTINSLLVKWSLRTICSRCRRSGFWCRCERQS